MAVCSEIISHIRQIAPHELAEEWDNIGLLVGSAQKTVKKVLVCLDVTTGSLTEAIRQKTDMIVTHHPVIFKGMKSLDEDKLKGKLICSLIRNNICVYSAHTNLDYAESGVNAQLAALLGISSTVAMGKGPGKAGELDRKYSLDEFICRVKKALNVPFVRVIGRAESGVRKVAVFGGSFDDNLEAVIETGADVLVTGDIKYHTALDAIEAGICIIDAGHFNTEKIVLPYLSESILAKFPGVDVTLFQQEDPFLTY